MGTWGCSDKILEHVFSRLMSSALIDDNFFPTDRFLFEGTGDCFKDQASKRQVTRSVPEKSRREAHRNWNSGTKMMAGLHHKLASFTLTPR
jgi:hypothetical protein